MNYKKLNVLFVTVIASVLLVSMTPAIGSGRGMENRGIYDRYRINAWAGWQVMAADTDAYVQHGIGYDWWDKKTMAADQPLDVEYFIDGEEIKLQRHNEIWPNQWHWTSPGPYIDWLGNQPKGEPEVMWFLWYTTFDAGYFEPGIYALHMDYYIQGAIIMQADGWLEVV